MTSVAELGLVAGRKPVLILTGPPGAGKTTWAEKTGLPVYDQNLANKSLWRDFQGDGPIILITAAPRADAKKYWSQEAKRFGFTPTVAVLDPGRSICVNRLNNREFVRNDGQRRRLAKSVQRWYTNYSAYPDEIAIDGR